MSSIEQTIDALEAAVESLCSVDWPSVGSIERLKIAERVETCLRRQRAASHRMVHNLDEDAVGAPAPIAVSDMLRISRGEARRRLRDAEQLSPRTTLTGQPAPPILPATSGAWTAGVLDPEHLRTIQTFMAELPHHIAPAEAEKAESFLAQQAGFLRPDQLSAVAGQLAIRLNPDGKFSDADRALKRGFSWSGRQRPDGMSVGKLVASPELRAMLDACFAKLAAPGMCNPADQTPTVTAEPPQDVIDRDARGRSQRQHDALSALVRRQLGDPALGRHRGLPVTVIATVTVQELQQQTGYAVTGGGTLLPMSDLIRMASHAWHYLCVFDEHTSRPLYLGRAKRIATADQRLVLHAKDRGCSAPGCTIPGYLTEVHHVEEWCNGGMTNVDKLTFACKPHHRLIKRGGWRTRKRPNGRTEWIPPPGIPLSGGVNDYHHPEREQRRAQRRE